MAVEQRPVPIDPIIEMPHPLLVYDVRPDEPWNYDHMFFPESSPLLQGLGGIAVRRCYGQLIPVRIHDRKNKWFDSVPLPETEDEQFRTVVKGLAGVVSRWAIDMRLVSRGAEDPLVYMDDQVFERTTDRFSVYHEQAWRIRGDKSVRREVGSFMMHYALRANIREIVPESVIDEFLSSKDSLQRYELGNFIINQAMRARLDPIVPEIATLRRLGLVQKGKPGLWRLPRKIIPGEKKQDYHALLAARLAMA